MALPLTGNNQYKIALKYLYRSMDLFKKLDNKEEIIAVTGEIGDIYFSTGKLARQKVFN